METLEELKFKIEKQFAMLSLAEDKSKKVLVTNSGTEIMRHMSHVEKKLEIEQLLKQAVQEKMVGDNKELEKFEEWLDQLEVTVLQCNDLTDKSRDKTKASMEKNKDSE